MPAETLTTTEVRADISALRTELSIQGGRLGELAVEVARLQEKDKAINDKLIDMSDDIKASGADIKDIKVTVNKAQGGWYVLVVLGAAIGTVVGWMLSLLGIPHQIFK